MKNELKMFLAFFFVFILLAPILGRAETGTEEEEKIEITQENGDAFTNITDLLQTNKSNEDTWLYRPDGRLLCGMLEESLLNLSFDFITSNNNFAIVTKFKFSSMDIISGSSYMIVRLPLKNTSAIKNGEVYFSIWEAQSGYEQESAYNLSMMEFPKVKLVYQATTQLIDDDGITEYGNNFYRINDRIYFLVHAPILPEHTYLFGLSCSINAGQNPEFYLTTDDICSDGIRDSSLVINMQDIANPTIWHSYTYNVSVDTGWSFLIRDTITLGGIATYNSQFGANEKILFRIFLNDDYKNKSNVYQNIMLPFISDSQISVFIRVENYQLDYSLVSSYTINENANDFLLFHSPTKVNTGEFVEITITFLTTTNITFLLTNKNKIDVYQNYLYYMIHIDSSGNPKHYIWFNMYCSYNQSDSWFWQQLNYTSFMKISTLSIKRQITTVFQRMWTWIKDKTGDAINWVINQFSSARNNIPDPLDWLEAFKQWIEQKLNQLKDKLLDMLAPYFKDLYKQLEKLGKFVKKIGMKILKVYKYIIKNIVYFGTALLGLLLLLVEMIVFIILLTVPAIAIHFEWLIVTGQTDKLIKIVTTIIHGYKTVVETNLKVAKASADFAATAASAGAEGAAGAAAAPVIIP